ncbi:aluminum-activated malate transporter 10-like [Canna indica]|uniref:Aluminum-activated malate transporter 10-like n=1 Tax=Canna indica TaxID=4628 RepID=A0AAQ3KCM8_9LILI|nr:aluminum-activated malate transporter 10-like [Canna indica]
MDEDMVSIDSIEFHSEEEPYRNRIASYQRKTGLTEAVQTSIGQLKASSKLVYKSVSSFIYNRDQYTTTFWPRSTFWIAAATDMAAPAMATENKVQGGVEWRVTVSEGSSVAIESESNWIDRARIWLMGVVLVTILPKATNLGKKIWKIGADDPRRVVHGVKVGIALTLVSLIYYTRPLYDGVGGWAMWAVMTVVVVLEYTVGGCLYKGFNRAVATSTAGLLAVGIHWIASKCGEKAEPVILSASVFILGKQYLKNNSFFVFNLMVNITNNLLHIYIYIYISASAATFSRFIPTIKARFDYGITVFILTFSLVAVSGYRVDELLQLAQGRIYTIGIGIAMCFLVSLLICPVWAGQELHLLSSHNMEKLANSLEGLIEDYFKEEKESPSARSQGYKCVLNSKSSEDSQANLARWEPAHGRFGFRHPWSQYLKIGAAMRYCAYCMEALNGCINSDIQAPESMKKHLRDVCLRLSSASSKVLKELSSSIMSMTESRSTQVLVSEMNDAVQELQVALRSLPKQISQPIAVAAEDESQVLKKHPVPRVNTVSIMEAMPLITTASLLIEVSERIEGVVDAVGTLARLACFEYVDQGKKTCSAVVPQDDESVKHSEQV